MRRGLIILAVSIFLVLVLVGAFFSVRSAQRRAFRESAFHQLWAAMQAYANESKGMFYPPKCPERGTFLPDVKAMLECDPYCGADKVVAALARQPGGRPLCYLGYFVLDEDMGERLLSIFNGNDSDSWRGKNLDMERDARETRAYAFREGIERFFIYDIGNPDAAVKKQAEIPVFWEMPHTGRDYILVCFLDGHVATVGYPGKFPFTVGFVNSLRKAMSLPTEPEIPSQKPPETALDKAVHLVTDIGKRWGEAPFDALDLVHCDTTPSVLVDGANGYRVEFVRGDLLVLFPVTDDSPPPDLSNAPAFRGRSGRIPPIYMGKGMGFHWYGQSSYYWVPLLRKKCGLVGGEDDYTIAAKFFGIKPHPSFHNRDEEEYKKAGPSQRRIMLQRACESADSAWVYRNMYFCLREMDSIPVAKDLLDALGIVMSHWSCCTPLRLTVPQEVIDEAWQWIDASSDEGALIAGGIAAAVSDPSSLRAGSRALDLVRGLPRDKTLPLLRRFAAGREARNDFSVPGSKELLDLLSPTP